MPSVRDKPDETSLDKEVSGRRELCRFEGEVQAAAPESRAHPRLGGAKGVAKASGPWVGSAQAAALAATEGVKVSERTINRILKRLGAMRREDCHRPALSRFERERPNELWQMDFKGEYVLRGGKNCYPLSMIDDHSRFSVGLYGLPGTSYQSGPV